MITEILDAITADVREKGVMVINIELRERCYRKVGISLWMESADIDGSEFNASEQRLITFVRNGVEVNIKPKS